MNEQTDWRWCHECQGLFLIGGVSMNVVEMDRYVAPALVGASQLETAIDGAKAGLMSALSGASFLFLNVLAKKYCDEVYLPPGKQPNSRTSQDSMVLEDALSDTTIVLVNPR